MEKLKAVQREKSNGKEQARQILRNGILNGMCVEKLIQMTEFGLIGNINCKIGTCGSSQYFTQMNYLKAENKKEQDLLAYSYVKDEEVISSTFIAVNEIGDISGCINKDNPDNVLDINIVMSDGAEITINVIY